MEFTLMCPNDGRVDLSLEDITAAVFRGMDSVEVVFGCPHCGTSLRAMLKVPNLMAAASEIARHFEDAQAASGGQGGPENSVESNPPATHDDVELRATREAAGEPYCEYFRRQLATVECVEDALAEIDAQRR
jgi:hypothetical protein